LFEKVDPANEIYYIEAAIPKWEVPGIAMEQLEAR
jgi:hypothetical protein